MKAVDSRPNGRLIPKKGPAQSAFRTDRNLSGIEGVSRALTGSTLVVMVDIKKIVNPIKIKFLFSMLVLDSPISSIKYLRRCFTSNGL
jgi:hypothetical protein